MEAKREANHAEQNARGWSATIAQMVAALEVDYDRIRDLRAFKEEEGLMKTEAEDELFELTKAATIDGDLCDGVEDAIQRIQEAPLSVQIRSGWYTPGEQPEPEEFEILLTTGGPALRIRGELDEYKQPCRAWLEYQDWGTPWTEFHGEGAPSQDDLLTFAQQFFYGE